MEENKQHGKEMPNVLNYDLTNTKLKFKDSPPSPVEEDRNSGEPQLKEFNGHEGQNPKESTELVTENPSREAEMQSEEGLDDNREEIACKVSELRTEDSDVDKKEKPSKDVEFPSEESDLNKDENPGKEMELKSEDHDVNKEENPIKDVGLQSEDHDVNKEENPSKDVGMQSEDLDVNMEENPGKDKDPAINKGENLSEHTELQSEDPDVNMDENPSKDVGLQYEDSDVLKDENSSKDLGLQSVELNVHKDENLSKDAELQSEDSGAKKDENPSKNVGLQSDHPDAMQVQSPGEDEDSQSQDLDDLDEQSPGETDDSLSEDLDDDMGVSSSEEEEHNPRKNVKFPSDDHSLVKIAVSKTPSDSKVDVNANGVHGKSQTDGSKVSFETKAGDDENGNEPMDAVKGKDAVKGMKFSGREMKEEVSKSKLDDIKEEETLPKFDAIKEEMLKSEVDVVTEEVLKPKLDAEPVVVKSSNHSFLLESAEGDESGTEEEQAAFMKELETFFRERLMEFKPPKFYGVELNLLKLYRAVIRLGGYEQVTSCKLWRQVGESFKPPKTCTTVSWTFRGFYEKALLEYEKHKMPNGELSLPDALTEPSIAGNQGNQASGSGRTRRDAAARAMQGWHSRLHGNGEVGDPVVKDNKNLSSGPKREKQLKNIGISLKRKSPSSVEHAVKVARMKTTKAQLDTMVVDVGSPADWVKINVRKTNDCFEVYALVPGLLREEVRVQSDPAGRLVISGEPEHLDNPWGVTPFKKVVSFPSRIDPKHTSAVVTLYGQLFVRVPFEQSDSP